MSKFTWNELTLIEKVALQGLGGEQGVWVRPSMVRALDGNANHAMVLSHLIYWSKTDKAQAQDGWFFHTSQKIYKETGISYKVQKKVREKLDELGLIETKRIGQPAQNHYRLNLEKIVQWIGSEGTSSIDQREDLDLTRGQNIEEQREEHTSYSNTSYSHSPAGDVPNSSLADSGTTTVTPGRVSKPKNIGLSHPGTSTRNPKVCVLGEKMDAFIQWVVDKYPRNAVGLGATEGQARSAAYKVGGVPSTTDQQTVDRVRAEMKLFIQGITNIIEASKSGDLEPTYVPGFAKFSGLGVMYGAEPGYKAWATRQVKKDNHRELVV